MTKRKTRARRPDAHHHFAAPDGLRATRLSVGGAPLVLLSFPLSTLLEPTVAAALPALTEAEGEVLAMVLRGATNAQVALRRGTSVRTVANQLASVYDKLGVRGRAALCALFRAL